MNTDQLEEAYLEARETLDTAHRVGKMSEVMAMLDVLPVIFGVDRDELLHRFLKHNIFLLDLEDVKANCSKEELQYYIQAESKFGIT